MTNGTIARDRWDRPLIVPPEGGTPVGYTRVTTFAGSIEDQSGLTKWKQRTTAIGLADRPDLMLAVNASRDDKRELGKLVDQAMEAGGASTSSNKGTAVHLLSEKLDRGETLPPGLPDDILRDLELYRAATHGMNIVEIEEFLVCDELQAAGTTDRIWEFGGNRYIGDLKTGQQIDLGILKIAIQLAIYSRSVAYDEDTGARSPINVSQDWGIVAHLPVEKGEINLYWIDLNLGWRGALLAQQVREIRKIKMKDAVSLISSSQEAAA